MTTPITRVEVIDWTKNQILGGGRVLTHWNKNTSAHYILQDDGRTLKVFIEDKDA